MQNHPITPADVELLFVQRLGATYLFNLNRVNFVSNSQGARASALQRSGSSDYVFVRWYRAQHLTGDYFIFSDVGPIVRPIVVPASRVVIPPSVNTPREYVITYTYRADGLRHTVTVNGVATTHVWNGQHIVLERNAAGAVINRFVRGASGQLIRSEHHGFYSHNARGDVIQRTNAQGVVLRSYRYTAFGLEINPDANDSNRWRFAGEYWDWETQTYYLRARNFNPRTGRFTQPDPFWNIGNMTSSPAAIAQSSNLFIFTMNNPVRFIDPSGLFAITPEYVANMAWQRGIPATLAILEQRGIPVTLAILEQMLASNAGVLTGIGATNLQMQSSMLMKPCPTKVYELLRTGGELVWNGTKWVVRETISAGHVLYHNLVVRPAEFIAKHVQTAWNVVIGWFSSSGSALQPTAAQINNAMKGTATFTVKNKHLSGAPGNWAQFDTNSATQVNTWVQNGLQNATNFTVNSADSFFTIVDMGQVIGTRGEQAIKIVFTVCGKIITSYPVR